MKTRMLLLRAIYMIKTFFKAKILYLIILLSYRFNKTKIIGESNIKNLDSFILVSWHGKILTVFHYFANKNYIGLASISKDAELIVRVGELIGYSFVRGSSSRGGSDAYKDMVRLLKISSTKIIITPDGPQGPEHVPKPGAIKLAQETGVPIIPVIGDAKKSWVFKNNWHNFYLSKPFSPIKLVVGEPIYFHKEESLDACIQKLKEKLSFIDKVASQHE